MKIYIGTDHAGFELKEKLLIFLKELKYLVVDMGAYDYDKTDDYPDYIEQLADKISKDIRARGIILGGSGEGEAMDANRFIGVRAGVYYGGDVKIVELLRKHNNANILSIGARFINEDEAKEAVKIFLETEFSGNERHIRRIKKIDNTIVDKKM